MSPLAFSFLVSLQRHCFIGAALVPGVLLLLSTSSAILLVATCSTFIDIKQFDSRVGRVESCKWAGQRQLTGSLVAQNMHHIVTCIPQCITGQNFLSREVFRRPDHLIEQRLVPALPAHEEDPVLVKCQVVFVGPQSLNCGVSMSQSTACISG